MISKPSKIKDHNCLEVLNGRNLIFNREKFINSKKIKLYDHLIWWFNNNCESFFFKTHNNEKIFLIIVAYVLRWQLKLNKKNSKNYDWIAVVKKNNLSVKKLTHFLGYRNVSKNNKHYEIIKNTFNVSPKNYYYLHLKNNL